MALFAQTYVCNALTHVSGHQIVLAAENIESNYPGKLFFCIVAVVVVDVCLIAGPIPPFSFASASLGQAAFLWTIRGWDCLGLILIWQTMWKKPGFVETHESIASTLTTALVFSRPTLVVICKSCVRPLYTSVSCDFCRLCFTCCHMVNFCCQNWRQKQLRWQRPQSSTKILFFFFSLWKFQVLKHVSFLLLLTTANGADETGKHCTFFQPKAPPCLGTSFPFHLTTGHFSFFSFYSSLDLETFFGALFRFWTKKPRKTSDNVLRLLLRHCWETLPVSLTQHPHYSAFLFSQTRVVLLAKTFRFLVSVIF